MTNPGCVSGDEASVAVIFLAFGFYFFLSPAVATINQGAFAAIAWRGSALTVALAMNCATEKMKML